ncbi:MAG: putative 3-methyladenine DNA glycosylase [Saprospiraceae bacterium]|nr:MAG: putative 3-methyladenine DNA glycosylase [Saprospiraceae bacterium]
MNNKLKRDFYQREDVLQISKDLLGKYLVTNFEGQLTAGMIVETEAYRAPDDKASHAYLNRFTDRTKVMFEAGGVAYIYLCYGIHHMFNVVTAQEGIAHAILIRAMEPVDNIELMQQRRQFDRLKPQLTAGPGVMSKALGILTQYTGTSLVAPDSPIWIEDRDHIIPPEAIVASPRVGVDYAEECASWPWRFRVKNSKWTSKAK